MIIDDDGKIVILEGFEVRNLPLPEEYLLYCEMRDQLLEDKEAQGTLDNYHYDNLLTDLCEATKVYEQSYIDPIDDFDLSAIPVT